MQHFKSTKKQEKLTSFVKKLSFLKKKKSTNQKHTPDYTIFKLLLEN